jgi:hypothetical protein
MGMFGVQDQLYKVSDTKMTDEAGKPIYICQHVKSYFVFLGVYARDEGLVMSTDWDRGYFPMPDSTELKSLQQEGLIPNPLPQHGMNFFDKLFGFSLWWAILGCLAYSALISKSHARKRLEAEANAAKLVEVPAADQVTELTEPQSVDPE